MSQPDKVEIEVAVDPSNASKGVNAVKADIDKMSQGAEASAGKAARGFDGLSSSVGTLRKLLTGLGVAGLFTAIYSGVSRIADSFKAASKQAEAFGKIQDGLAKAKGVQQLVSAYEKLKSAAAAAASEQSHALQMIDEGVSNRRRLDSAKLEQSKLAELAALDPEAQDYAEQKAKIEADYASRSAAMNASNAREDVVLARQKLDAEAANKEKEAEAQDAATEVARRKLDDARREKSKSDVQAVELNENDKTTTASAIGKTLSQLFTGDWGRLSGATTAEGDQVRSNAAQRSADLEVRIAELEEEVRKSEERAASLRTDAGRLRERRDAMGDTLEAAEIEGKNARTSARAAESEASRALAKKQADIKDEDERKASAQSASEELARAKALLERQIEREQERKDAAGQSVFRAQNAVDLARANGQSTAAPLAELQSAQSAANEVAFSADKAIAALTETLKQVETRLDAATRYLKNAESRNRDAWTDGNSAN